MAPQDASAYVLSTGTHAASFDAGTMHLTVAGRTVDIRAMLHGLAALGSVNKVVHGHETLNVAVHHGRYGGIAEEKNTPDGTTAYNAYHYSKRIGTFSTIGEALVARARYKKRHRDALPPVPAPVPKVGEILAASGQPAATGTSSSASAPVASEGEKETATDDDDTVEFVRTRTWQERNEEGFKTAIALE